MGKGGQVPNVVFVEGMVRDGNRWLFYNGGADKNIGVANGTSALNIIWPDACSGGYPFVFFSLMMALQFFVVLFVYPETKGVSLEQMQKKLGIA
jgi:hypothetical protein